MFHLPQRHTAPLTLLLAVAALGGCATAPSGTSTPTNLTSSPPRLSPTLSGNWMAVGTSPTPTTLILSPIAGFTGSLQVSGSTLTGVLRAVALPAPGCVALTTDLPATATLDAADNLTIVAPLAGGVATIIAALPQDLHTFIHGTYRVVGGTCAMSATPMALSQFAPATGTYTGTFHVLDLSTQIPLPGTETVVTAVLVQSTAPNGDGQFPLTGTVAATGACLGTLAIANGIVFGDGVLSHPLTVAAPPSGELLGTISPSASTFTGLLDLCKDRYSGTLTRQ